MRDRLPITLYLHLGHWKKQVVTQEAPGSLYFRGSLEPAQSPHNDPTPRVLAHTPSMGSERESFLSCQPWHHKAQRGLQALAASSLPPVPSCFPVSEAERQASIPLSHQRRAGVKETWWDGPPAPPSSQFSRVEGASKIPCAQLITSSAPQKTFPEDSAFPPLSLKKH